MECVVTSKILSSTNDDLIMFLTWLYKRKFSFILNILVYFNNNDKDDNAYGR